MKNLLVIVFVLLASSLFAQTAKVVELTPQEAARAKALHEAAAQAKKASDDFDNEVADKYTVAEGSTKTMHVKKDGWSYGFEFSSDFRFIVPKPYMRDSPNCGNLYFNTLTPGAGITYQ